MREALSEESCPLDATVESVLPGVHHRLDLQRKQLADVHQEIKGLLGKVAQENDKTRTRLLDAIGSSLFAASATISRAIGEGGEASSPSGSGSGAATAGTNDSRDRTHNRVSATKDDGLLAKHQDGSVFLMAFYPRLSDLFDHWFGSGLYEKSVPGGIDLLERHKKSKWRSSFTTAQKKQFCCAKLIVTAMVNISKAEEKELGDVVAAWEDVYQTEAKCRLSNMVDVLQDRAVIVKKKARGKTALLQ